MSAATFDRNATADVNAAAPAQQPSLFSRVVTALQHSRELQARREIERHRHLIEHWRAYDPHRDVR